MKTVLSVAALLGLCALATADCRRVVRVQHAAVIEVQPVVAAVFAPVPVVVPTYTVGYHDSGTQELIAEVRAMRQQLAALQAGPQSQKTPAPAAVHPGLAFLKNSCVNCHDAQVSKAKGGGNTFFSAGELLNLNDAQRLAITTAIYSGRMPKGGKATDEDVGAVISFFDKGAAASAQTMPPAK